MLLITTSGKLLVSDKMHISPKLRKEDLVFNNFNKKQIYTQ